MGEQAKIGPLVVKAILTYVKWALRDVGIEAKKFPSLFVVHHYSPNFADSGEPAFDEPGSGYDDSEMSGLEDLVPSVEGTDSEENGFGDDYDTQMTDDDDEADVEAARRFTHAVTRDLKGRMQRLAEEWRHHLQHQPTPKSGAPKIVGPGDKPPTLYGFAVVQHMVMVVSLDASKEESRVVSLETINLYNRGQWLWNALSMAIPINIAKDDLAKIDRLIEQRPRQNGGGTSSDSDPDR